MGQRARMTELRPDVPAVARPDSGETSQATHVRAGSENEVSRLLRIPMVDLHLTNERQGGTAR